jgi:thioredoxin-related protein
MSNMRKTLLIVAPIMVAIIALSFKPAPKPQPAEAGIKWMNWDEMQEAQKKQPRKVVVDVFTDWCGWCKRMEASTFTNPEIIKFVNENYYAVKFDAETKSTIKFRGKDYKFVPEGVRGYNELAAEILNNQMSYPTTVYFDESLVEIFPVPGYQEPKMFETVLNFVSSNSYKQGAASFDSYEKNFKGKIK